MAFKTGGGASMEKNDPPFSGARRRSIFTRCYDPLVSQKLLKKKHLVQTQGQTGEFSRRKRKNQRLQVFDDDPEFPARSADIGPRQRTEKGCIRAFLGFPAQIHRT